MRDVMTPLERVSLLLIDEEPDRPVRIPFLTVHAAAAAGLAPGDCCRDPELLARAQLAAQERYGHDAFTVFSDVGIVAEAVGSGYRHRAADVPILDRPVLDRPEDLDRLVPPDPDAGRLGVLTGAVRLLHRAKGDEVPVFCLVPAPFTTAAGLRGIEDLLVEVLLEPEFAHRLIDFAVSATVPLLDEIVLAGGLPALVDPLASASVASPRIYREFAAPATRRLIERLHRLDLDVMLHVCWETEPILGEIASTGADLFSFDRTPIPIVLDAIGDRVRLVGNVAIETLLSGTPAEVRRAGARAAAEGASAPRGYVFSTGCEVPARTPPANVHELMAAGLAAAKGE